MQRYKLNAVLIFSSVNQSRQRVLAAQLVVYRRRLTKAMFANGVYGLSFPSGLDVIKISRTRKRMIAFVSRGYAR